VFRFVRNTETILVTQGIRCSTCNRLADPNVRFVAVWLEVSQCVFDPRLPFLFFSLLFSLRRIPLRLSVQ
jgi:hypothetical protein